MLCPLVSFLAAVVLVEVSGHLRSQVAKIYLVVDFILNKFIIIASHIWGFMYRCLNTYCFPSKDNLKIEIIHVYKLMTGYFWDLQCELKFWSITEIILKVCCELGCVVIHQISYHSVLALY